MSSSSSSEELSSTDEEENTFLSLVGAAVTLLFENNASTSTPRVRGPTLKRDRDAAYDRLINDYFSENPIYNDDMFRRRFRMSKQLFLRIVGGLESRYEFFQWRWDHRGKRGFSPMQKCTAAIKLLAYGVTSDMLDDYLQMSEKIARTSLHKFCEGIISLFGQQYLRKPNHNDVQKLYAAHEAQHGFVGMLGSIDCTHWEWKNCPVAWRGQYMRGDHPHPTIILQAVASHDLWIWDSFFGVAGSNNDINVLNYSPLMSNIIEGKIPAIPFVVNGAQYTHGYYLTDGIYPEWAIFVKSFTCPIDEKRKNFKTAQEAARKDIERAFGVLKQRWHMLHQPARQWTRARLQNIMYACIILHNMILEDEGQAICGLGPNEFVPEFHESELTEEQRYEKLLQLRNRKVHNNLRSDLVEHIWSRNNQG